MPAVLSFRTLAVVCLLLAGCTVTNSNRDGGGVPPGTDAPFSGVDAPPTPTTGLRIEPANQMVVLSGAPIVIDYHAIFRAADGSETDVTSECTWSATVAALGTFTGSTFTTNLLGGVTSIRAVRGADVATTMLTITGDQVILLPGVPADAPDRFGGTVDPSHAPEIVYPADHVMVPPNLGELEFHYNQVGNVLFELAFTAPTSRIRIYMECPEAVGGGCAFVPEPAVWSAISTALAGQGEITYTLRGVDGAGVVGTSAERHLRVAGEAITGGLYYWNSAGTIDRFEFGLRGARAENFITPATAMAGVCVGCHALSRDGTRIALGTDIPTTTFQVFDVATRTRLFSLGGFFPMQPSFFSFGPSTSGPPTEIVTSGTMGLDIRDVTTGAVTAAMVSTGPATMPDWSADGDRIVYVRYGGGVAGFDQPFISSGSIEMLTRSGGTWTAAPTLVSGGGNNYYPAFSPDGDWVAFCRSPSNASNGADMGMPGASDAQLWIIRADGSAGARELETADHPGDSWAKWDPTEYVDRGSSIFWLTWSSSRSFGLRWADGGAVQLWMAAFDESLADAGMDPVLAAFRLPFQDAASGNHIAQWVTSIERLGCDDDTDCGGEFCVDGRCYEEPPAPF